jgi:hypothetical protein
MSPEETILGRLPRGRRSSDEPEGGVAATHCMNREPDSSLEMPSLHLVTRCSRCPAPSVETVTAVFRDQELEIDLCDRHRTELLSGSRPAPSTEEDW